MNLFDLYETNSNIERKREERENENVKNEEKRDEKKEECGKARKATGREKLKRAQRNGKRVKGMRK